MAASIRRRIRRSEEAILSVLHRTDQRLETLFCSLPAKWLKIVFLTCNIIVLVTSCNAVSSGISVIKGDISIDLGETEDLEYAAEQIGIPDLDTSNLDLTIAMRPVGEVLVVLGLISMAVSALGIACLRKLFLLRVYVLCVFMSFLMVMSATFLYYTQVINRIAKPYAEQSLVHFAGIEATDPNSLFWNAVMNYHRCCGVTDYRDFLRLKHWPPAPVNHLKTHDQLTPLICCKQLEDVPGCAERSNATVLNNSMFVGCYRKIIHLLQDHPVVVKAFMFPALFMAISIYVAIAIGYIEDMEEEKRTKKHKRITSRAG